MVSEEELIRSNQSFLYQCAWEFCRERGLSPALYLEDVFQEAATAYIQRKRVMASHPDEPEFMPIVIRRHLGHKFRDIHGVCLPHSCDWTTEQVINATKAGITRPPCWTENDSILYMDYERWKKTLNKKERRLVTMLENNVPIVEIARRLHIHRHTCDCWKRAVQRSFMTYFKEAG